MTSSARCTRSVQPLTSNHAIINISLCSEKLFCTVEAENPNELPKPNLWFAADLHRVSFPSFKLFVIIAPSYLGFNLGLRSPCSQHLTGNISRLLDQHGFKQFITASRDCQNQHSCFSLSVSFRLSPIAHALSLSLISLGVIGLWLQVRVNY